VDDSGGRWWLGWETALGGLLVLLGIVILLGLDLGRIGWPVFVLVPGLGLLGVGLAARGRSGELLATVGGLVAEVRAPAAVAGSGSGNARRCRTVLASAVQTRAWVVELSCLLDSARACSRWGN
jgi:hypothetical protein